MNTDEDSQALAGDGESFEIIDGLAREILADKNRVVIGHYARFTQGLSDEVVRSGWIVLAFCWMSNHIHALIKTPEPNLCRGMQHWLSGPANWYVKRNRRTAHLYQGRYKAFWVESEALVLELESLYSLEPL